MQQYQVSRMTMRQAILALVKDAILTRRRGHGTFVNLSFIEFLDDLQDQPDDLGLATNGIRQRNHVWAKLREVALPDSRFHWDFSLFIPDFQGSTLCVEALCETDMYRSSSVLFVAPDNSLTSFRRRAIEDQKTVLVATSGISRGFRLFVPGCVPIGQEELAATLDGMDRFSQPAALSAIRQLGAIDMMVTGVSFTTLDGVRSGLGYGYFDIEWAIFSELGVALEETSIIAIAHDSQVIDMQMGHSPSDARADWIVTPTRMIQTLQKQPRPVGVIWSHFSPDLIDRIPFLRDLALLKAAQLA